MRASQIPVAKTSVTSHRQRMYIADTAAAVAAASQVQPLRQAPARNTTTLLVIHCKLIQMVQMESCSRTYCAGQHVDTMIKHTLCTACRPPQPRRGQERHEPARRGDGRRGDHRRDLEGVQPARSAVHDERPQVHLQHRPSMLSHGSCHATRLPVCSPPLHATALPS